MANLALVDLLLPYLLRGENLGPQHAALSAIRVMAYETGSDAFGISIRGRCEFNGHANIVPTAGGLQLNAGVDEAAPGFDPNQRDPVFDLGETAIEFELFVPRVGSAIVATGTAGLTGNAGFAPVQDVLNVWDTLPVDPDPSDFPATGFSLDLILDAPSVRPPFLHPAKLTAAGVLMPDDSVAEVSLTLPRLRFRLSHGSTNPSRLRFELVSLGTTGLDDPGDLGVAELISMNPPYAYVGGPKDRVFGFGFRSATLDLSSDWTPPALKEKAGVGDDWTGLYLPEARVFVSPDGVKDFALEAGARELLIGIGPGGSGVWGDFEAALVNQGDGELVIGARFADAAGNSYGIERISPTQANARIPEHTRLVVDVSGGRTPYSRKVKVGGAAEQTGSAFVIDLSAAPTADIVITITDSSATPVTAALTIAAERRTATPVLATPGPQTAPALPAALSGASGPFLITISSQSDTQAVLTTNPPDSALLWTVDGGPASAPQASLTVDVAPGTSHTVRLRKPGTNVPAGVDFYYYFDEPPPVTVSTAKATSKLVRQREGLDQDPIAAYRPYFELLANGASITVVGEASYEGTDTAWHRDHNYQLAWRRALGVKALIEQGYPGKSFTVSASPQPAGSTPTKAEIDAWVTASGWHSHVTPNDRDWWKAAVSLPALSTADAAGQVSIARPVSKPPTDIVPADPTPTEPEPPDWFRSAKVLVRIVESDLIALQIDCEVDFQTMSEQKLNDTGQLQGAVPPTGRTLQRGTPVGPDNPADGITKMRVLVQSDPGTGRMLTLMSIGADPADKDGLFVFGWIPGEPVPAAGAKDYGLTLLGSYLSFWPLLANFPPVDAGQKALEGDSAAITDVALAGAALATPGIIAALPWFRVERVMVFGAEYLQKERGDAIEGNLLFDIGIDWSASILDIIVIKPESPLSVRYKAIGLRFGNRDDTGAEQFVLRPVFDSSRGYTIDLARGGSLTIAEPLGQILRVLGARLSRTNPLTFEIDIGLGVDLGVVSIERASLRAYLDEPRPPELTALAASVDIPGALVGSGYVRIGSSTDADGNVISTIGGQLDLTLRPINLRVAAAVEIATIPAAAGGPATGVYVGLNVVLPVGIPLGTSGLGIFGFRGIFGMHYERNPQIGQNTGVPALSWLKAADGKPHLLINPAHPEIELWVPHIDHWAFGLGLLIGTMEGGVILNLDGTLLLELPGPRLLIMMNARIISPPPSMDGLGSSGGILAVIEITPEHFLVGLLIEWGIEDLIKIVIPVEAMFPFGADAGKWHIYLGARPDYGQPVEVDVLGIVKGTGYLMFKGDGLAKYPVHNAELPAIRGFGIALGVGASFTWGDTDIGLYVRIGGGMDAVLGFDPFTLAGTIWVAGELRIFIVSVGADAQLTVIVTEADGELTLYIHGEACGHVSFLFFEVSGCVDITIAGPQKAARMPVLVDKVSLQSRSPALLAGTGVDRGVDVSLGDALAQDATPAVNDPRLVVVPIDAIPIVAMTVPPTVKAGLLTIGGLGTDLKAAPGVPADGFSERGAENYRFEITSLSLERIDPATGGSAGPAITGSEAPAVWWTTSAATDPSPVAQLALFTWAPSPATKAIEKTDHMVETVIDKWGTVCAAAAPPAEQLWTFRWEQLGASPVGWTLEGIAWPDPPGTIRSTQPDGTLPVSERWRSGDAVLDAMRGIFPALVIGSAVACHRDVRALDHLPSLTGIEAGPRLVIGGSGAIELDGPSGAAIADSDPVHAALVRRDGQAPLRITTGLYRKVESALARDDDAARPPLTALAASQLLGEGRALGRTQLLESFGPLIAARDTFSAADAAVGEPSCSVRLLEAPIFDDGRPIVIGDPTKQEFVKEQLDHHGVTHGPLDDVVVLHTGPFATFGVLLFIPRVLLEGERLLVRVLDKAGAERQLVAVTSDNLIWTTPLPARWTDPAGPWYDDIVDLLAWQQRSKTVPVYIELDKDPTADRVEIGTRGVSPGIDFFSAAGQQSSIQPSYYVAAAAETRWAEVERSDWDVDQISRDRDTLTNLLGPPSGNNALMYADSLYRLTVEWNGTRKGDGVTSGDAANPVGQHFWFRTDRIAAVAGDATKLEFTSTPPVPVRLDPWMLVTIPDDRETACFGRENVRLVFNTVDIDRLLDAYGKQLRVRFQASSGKHPESSPAAPHPFVIDATTLQPVVASILSPWESAVVEAIDILSVDRPFCVPVDEDRSRHSAVDIAIPLDPYTDYILDVELVDAAAAPDARGPGIYRRHFSTGGYGTFEQFAGSLVAPTPGARGSDPGAFAALAAHFAGRRPEGSELDDQLRAHGIEPLTVPQQPRIIVFWEQTGAADPQPAAVLIDAAEPLWRSRRYPTKVIDDSGPVPAERWVLGPRDWLVLQDSSGPGVLAPDGIILAPGAQRAFVVLAPNRRGTTVRIDLVDLAFPDLPFLNQAERRKTVVELTLDHAPWEDV